MSSIKATADPSRKRKLRSWTSAVASNDNPPAAADGAPDSPAASAAAAASPAQSSDAVPERKKARRQQLLAAAFGDQPRPPRWSDLSPAQRCFSDGLALAFSFLSLFELIRAARACRSWREAALKASVPGADLRDVVRYGSRLQSLVSSPFHRHVHSLIHGKATEWPTSRYFTAPDWTLLELAMLQHLPQLRRISAMSIDLRWLRDDLSTEAGTQPFTFPPLLQSVNVHLSFNPFELDDDEEEDEDEDWSTESEQRLVLEALRPCHSLTEFSLTLHPYIRLHLDPLQELVTLQTLRLDIALTCVEDGEWCMFKQEHMRVVQQLPMLQRLSLHECRNWEEWDDDDPFGTRWMRWLCPLPHRLQRLQALDLSQIRLHLEHMELLQQLPALTALEPAGMYESSIPVLPGFASRLQRLNFNFARIGDAGIGPDLIDFDTGFARGSWLVPHLTPCAALTQLTLRECVFSEVDATTLCQALSQLRDLDLDDVGWPSFESLRHLPLLESFSLLRAKAYPLHIDAAHFQPLHQLWHLSLSNLSPLSDAAQSVIDALHPPSALLPGLVTLTYSP